MRTINFTSQFKRDFKREAKGRYRQSFAEMLQETVDFLVNDVALPTRYHDHALTGEWADHRDCHVKPDMVLIYRTPDADTLQLVRVGSHSELGL
jgi:mRNA interferase YafQ